MAEDISRLGSPIVVFCPPAPIPDSMGNPYSRVQHRKIHGIGKFCDFRLKSPFILEMVRDSLVIAM